MGYPRKRKGAKIYTIVDSTDTAVFANRQGLEMIRDYIEWLLKSKDHMHFSLHLTDSCTKSTRYKVFATKRDRTLFETTGDKKDVSILYCDESSFKEIDRKVRKREKYKFK